MKVLNVKNSKFDVKTGVYIGRNNKTYNFKESKWHNPFVIDKNNTRDDVIKKYEEYILNNKDLYDSLEELDGYDLYCWCYPLKCHGDVLIKLLNEKKFNNLFL